MEEDFHMIGGEDKTSYAQNSWLQWSILEMLKPTLNECIGELFGDMGSYLHSGVKVGDLGCSSGPTAFLTAQNIMQSFHKHYEISINHNEVVEEMPSIQYFMNDMVSNDFNLLFKGLPEFYKRIAKENGSCLIAAVAGTFYGELFPRSSMHFLHSCFSLHWLSQAPKGLVAKEGISLNKWNIHGARTSPSVVQKVYMDQFRLDFCTFLRMRSRELMPHGQLLLTFLCENSEEDNVPNYLDLMGSALGDLVMEGYVEEEQLDYFNLPIFKASIDEIKKIIEDEGSFNIFKFHSFKTPLDTGYEFSAFRDADDPVLGRARYVAAYQRAVYEPVLASHFGDAIMDDLFHRYTDKLVDVMHNGKLLHNTVVISLKNH